MYTGLVPLSDFCTKAKRMSQCIHTHVGPYSRADPGIEVRGCETISEARGLGATLRPGS
jgi:hypothetical protein